MTSRREQILSYAATALAGTTMARLQEALESLAQAGLIADDPSTPDVGEAWVES